MADISFTDILTDINISDNLRKKNTVGRMSGINSTRSKPGLDRMSDLLLKSYAKDDISYLTNMSKKDTINLSYFLKRQTNIDYLAKQSGLSTEDIFDLVDDREAYLDLEKRTISTTAGAETKLKPQREFYKKAEDWITRNAKRYDDPEKFKKAFKRTFPKNNLLLDAINSNRESLNVQFSDSFKSEMFGTGEGLTLGGRSKKPVEVYTKIKDLSIPRRSVDSVFKTAIYNLNPTVRNKIINEFKNVVPKTKPSNKDLYNIKQSIRNNKLFKKFGVEKSIKGPISRLLYRDLGDDLSKQISSLRQPRLQTTSLLRVFRDLVNPKYKKQFTEALSAVESAVRKDIPEAKAKLKIAENINFDHKIPKSFIDAGYADEINYIKLNPTLESFNQGAKLNEFDKPMLALSRKYEVASKLEKPKILNKMKDLQSNFNKKYKNYLSNVSIKDVKGKPYFESTDLPLSKKTNIGKLIEEASGAAPKGLRSKGTKLNSFPAQLAELKIPKVNPLKKIGKIGKTGLKGLGKVLGVAAIPLEGYLMNEARKQGKSFAEIAAMPFLLEGKVAEYQDMMNMSPVERQAVNRENIEQDESLLDTDFYTPTLEGVEAVNIPGVKNRVATKRKIEEKLLAEKRAAPKQRFTLPNITGTIDDDFI